MGKNKPKEKPNIVLLTDPNSDPDDLVSYFLLADYIETGKANCSGLIVTKGEYMTRFRRARYAKGALNLLGHGFIKVSMGGEYDSADVTADNIFCDDENCRALENQGNAILRNAQLVFDHAVKKGKITLVVNSPMPDLAAILKNFPGSLKDKIKKIVIMGDICREKVGDFYYPDLESHNNFVCSKEAIEVYKIAQENNIRLVLVPKEAVYKLNIGRDLYDMLEKSDSLLAKCIISSNKNLVSRLWDTVRAGQCSHFDIHRFVKIFMGEDYQIASSQITLKDDFEKVWDNIKYFHMYDALSMIVAVDEDFKPFGDYVRLDEDKNIVIAEVLEPEPLKNKIYEVIRNKLSIKE